jgi:hypothetical protein
MTQQETETVEVPEGHGLMSTLDRSGDVRHMWDRKNEAEVSAARALFDSLVKPSSKGGKGHLAYKAEGKDGHKGEQLREFDPDAERIILVPQMVGG